MLEWQRAAVGEHRLWNKAVARTKINLILIAALQEERTESLPAPSNPTGDPPGRPKTPPPNPGTLYLGLETYVQWPVSYKDETRYLTGYADYVLSYDEDPWANLVVLEAKRPGRRELGEAQVVAYMGRHLSNS
jgi:hypothetical protein